MGSSCSGSPEEEQQPDLSSRVPSAPSRCGTGIWAGHRVAVVAPKRERDEGESGGSPETVGRSQPGGVDPSAAGELKARPSHRGGITAGRRRDD
ncbi:unnamed protein product [Arctogadus glacialis]